MIKKESKIQKFSEGWLKQPNSVVTMRHSFDVTQGRVVSAIIEKLQDVINGKEADQDVDALIARYRDTDFTELSKDNLVITLTYKDVGVTSHNYAALRDSLRKMASIPVDITIKDDSGNMWSRFAQLCSPIIPNEFDEYGNVTDLKYQHYFKVIVSKEVLAFLIDTKKGWHTYLRQVVMTTKNKYAFRFYLLMSAWKNVGTQSFSVKYLREWLKLENSFSRWNDFLSRVIRPAEKELQVLFEKGVCDLYFEYVLIYPEGKKRGEPDKVKFIIHSQRSLIPLADAEEVIPDGSEDLEHYLLVEFAQTENNRKDILSMVTEKNHDDFLKYCQEVLAPACKKKKNIKSLTGYCFASMIGFLKNWKPEEEVAEKVGPSIMEKYDAQVAKNTYDVEGSIQDWDNVVAYCKEHWTVQNFEKWVAPLKLLGNKDGVVFVKMPNALFGRDMCQCGAYQKLKEAWKMICGNDGVELV